MKLPPAGPLKWGGTLPVRSALLVTGGRTLVGDIHLQPNAPSHSGPETVADTLARDDAFFPLTGVEGHALLVAKAHVLALDVPPEAEPQDTERLSAARPLRLEVELSDGSTHIGTVACELPSDRPRPLDLMNERPGFFPLRTADVVRYINRAHVRLVTPLD